jgi:two-component system sensor histidine kinase MtrB
MSWRRPRPDGRRSRLSSLRIRLIAVFGLVALTAAVSASGIAYWLNRDSLLKRTQETVVSDFRKTLGQQVVPLPKHPDCGQVSAAAQRLDASGAGSGALGYQVLLKSSDADGPCTASTSADRSERSARSEQTGRQDRSGRSPAAESFTMKNVPDRLQKAVNKQRAKTQGNRWVYHTYWQRIELHEHPYLVVGSRVEPSGVAAYAFKSLEPERQSLMSLAWSLGIATTLALFGAALLAQGAAATVLRPVQRLADAARRLGEGRLDTRLQVRGSDELAELSRTFNATAEALQERVRELEEREESSRRFVADMSHELRTPLTAITAVSDLLEEEIEGLEPSTGQAVELVVNETRRLNDLVENLMEVTRLDAGTARLVLDDVEVADQVTACIDARAWLDAVDLEAPRGLQARLDPRRLDVILANLVGNGLKHGSAPVRVTVRQAVAAGDSPSIGSGRRGAEGPRLEKHGGRTVVSTNTARFRAGDAQLVIEVADRGAGIPAEVLPHVFDRFYKADSGRVRSVGLGGSGLGLSIALENARIHGGELSAANNPDGAGAIFTVVLPLRARTAEDEEREGLDGVDGVDGVDGPAGLDARRGEQRGGSA